MQLLTPLALALTALTGLVLVFHALRPRYTQQEVPSLRLWQTVTEALSLQARWRRIVRSLLLLVHLLIVLLLALAAAQPILTWRGESALHVHIVDASASMLATDVSPNRFDVAIRQAAASMGDQSGRWAVILAGSSPRLLYHGPSRQEAVNALLAAEPETGGADWAAAAICSPHSVKIRARSSFGPMEATLRKRWHRCLLVTGSRCTSWAAMCRSMSGSPPSTRAEEAKTRCNTRL